MSAARPPEGAHTAAEGEGSPASAARPPEGAAASALACRSVAWLALPGAGYLMLVFALPLAVLLASSFHAPGGALSLAGYARFFSDGYNATVVWNTLKIAVLVTSVCLLIGYPVAFAMARARPAVQALMFLALILPLSVGVIVKSFAWTILLRSNGLVNSTSMALGLADEPVKLLFNERGLVIAAVHVFLPFMVLPIFTVARQIDSCLKEAAATLGATPWYAFARVTGPLSLPGVVAGCAFVFSMAVSMYVIPALLIGDRYQTLPALVARAYLFMRDRQAGSTLAVVLLLIAVAIVVGSTLLTRHLQAKTSTSSTTTTAAGAAR
ncbi:ABC transporter permease [Verminephrobacter eiseniae]|uniref:ABC transporter permease n=2 Tax=Verminephrobacter eiseniae TaxID=364317 RepID=UPI0002DBAF28|nr:ABC transporter permease [Verminephrobacter eiseniae]